MKKSAEDWLTSFSFILPGAISYINGNKRKGIALFSVTIAGMVLYLFGGSRASALGIIVLAIVFGTNLLEVMFQPVFDSLNKIEKDLLCISEGLKFIVLELQKQDKLLLAMRQYVLLAESQPRFLPPPEQLLCLPAGARLLLSSGVTGESAEKV
ncbi:hypothetical protein M1295_00550 [Patescibacteria group bacterium]|nr:hypothetical protein [Patescibacteria group bacterium]